MPLIRVNGPVRGYRGQTVTADLAIAVQDGGDIGFRWNQTHRSPMKLGHRP